MGKSTQMAAADKPIIDEFSIIGTPEQIQRICSSWDKNEVELTIKVNDQLHNFQFHRKKDDIVLKLDTGIPCCFAEWKDLSINLEFVPKSQKAHIAISPLINNGMRVTAGAKKHLILSKKRISILKT